MKWEQKNPALHTIKDVVIANTGKTETELLNDSKYYDIPIADKIIKILDKAKQDNVFITVVGDYDADGVTSSTQWKLALKKKGIRHRIRLPKRHSEGYGLNEKIIDEIDDGIVLTVDNGIAALDSIKKAKEKGLYVIIVDHHQPVIKMIDGKPEKILPDADIILDPHAIDGQADFKYYCGAGLTYKIIEKWFKDDKMFVKKMSSFAAIGTICDVMPLIDDNRKIVKAGLKAMLEKGGRTIGLLKLMKVFNLEQRITAEDIGFGIGPAINACGRLGDPVAPKEADEALDLLTFSGDFDTAEMMAGKIAGRNLKDGLSVNETRKKLVKLAENKANQIIEDNAMFGDAPIVINIPNTNEGIIGIVAGHLTEKYQVPSIVFTTSAKDPNVLKGSGRSVEGVDLKGLLDKCSKDLLGYGGHPMAAGLAVLEKKLDTFREHIQEEIGEFFVSEKEFTYDLEIQESDIEELIPELDKYGPYGEGNPQPVFLIRNYKLFPNGTELFRISGADNEHVSFYGSCTKANAFWMYDKFVEMGEPKCLNLIGTLDVSFFGGKTTYGLKVIDMEPVELKPKSLTRFGLLLKKKQEEKNKSKEK